MTGYIADHYKPPFRMEEMVRYFHFSRSYLHRIFKRETGIAILEYLTHYRINRAKELLVQEAGERAAELMLRRIANPLAPYEQIRLLGPFLNLSLIARLHNPHLRQIAELLGVIQTIADNEFIGNVNAAVFDRNFDQAAGRFA